ncbi:glycosyltransferase family 2 protein [Hymenobacter monticola]|uniref:Glycosyltransferase n=1 Tax=Hymenobacter monticola TaxID=1705399 RepID=A0ABY4AY90_9BACT|nr:glycosyltransferase family 2 protein [Hymenobacter monticola]UOE31863.1 glycosyltransferase [Hymenobacter monticola]
MVPFFSIIIPTYNRAALIGRTIDSVLAQSFTNFEILVVDDGSRDNTAEVMARYTDSRFHYLPKINGERGAARNYGLAHATGDFCLFLDSDDFFYPNHLATIHAAIQAEATLPNFVATKYDVERDNHRRPCDIAALPGGYYGLDFFLNGNGLACNICVRRNNPGLHRFEEDRRYASVEDWMFMLQNMQHDRLLLIDAVTLTMDDHDARSMRVDNQALVQRLELAAGWITQHVQLSNAQRRRLLGRLYHLCAIHMHVDGHWRKALGYAQRAVGGLPARSATTLLMRTLLPPKVVRLLKRRLN